MYSRDHPTQNRPSWIHQVFMVSVGCLAAVTLSSCAQHITEDYEASALTTVTWRVSYTTTPGDKTPRIVEFTSSSLLNINGQEPENAFGNADDKGLWWPKPPQKPTLDEIESRTLTGENHGRPERLRTVKYSFSYKQDDQLVTLPTNYSVYRAAVKAHQNGQSLKLTLGVNNDSVQQAEAL